MSRQAEGTADRLHSLTRTMVKPKKGATELTGSGAQIRASVPFCLRMVNQWEPPLSVEAQKALPAVPGATGGVLRREYEQTGSSKGRWNNPPCPERKGSEVLRYRWGGFGGPEWKGRAYRRCGGP